MAGTLRLEVMLGLTSSATLAWDSASANAWTQSDGRAAGSHGLVMLRT